jgi:hypothetical protein
MADLSTIKQLDQWMTDNCYNDNYAIGDRNIHEGLGLDKFGSLFVWYYTERGQRENLKYFPTEREAVEFAFKQITSDKFANRHLIGFLSDKSLKLELLNELDNRTIGYWTDEIPYGGINNPKYRVFVFGCDFKRAIDLKAKYYMAAK